MKPNDKAPDLSALPAALERIKADYRKRFLSVWYEVGTSVSFWSDVAGGVVHGEVVRLSVEGAWVEVWGERYSHWVEHSALMEPDPFMFDTDR